MNLLLIGYRGSGKSTIARLFAEALDRPLIGMDAEIERRAGRAVRSPQAFEPSPP